MLFRKKIERSCSYCAHGTKTDDDTIICTKRGICSGEDSCWRFRYDPCKRVPFKAKALDFSQFKDRDFALED